MVRKLTPLQEARLSHLRLTTDLSLEELSRIFQCCPRVVCDTIQRVKNKDVIVYRPGYTGQMIIEKLKVNPSTVRQLADSLGVKTQAIKSVITRMFKNNLVARRKDKGVYLYSLRKPKKVESNDDILVEVCEKLGYSIASIQSKDRSKKLVERRARVYRALRDEGLSLPEIGRLVNRDHTTVLYSLSKQD